MRRSELLNCTRAQVDLKQRRIFLPDMKSGERRYVPLNPAACDIIEGLPRMVGNDYLLPGHLKGRPLNNIDKPWRRIRGRAELPRLRIPDLRRTAGSLMIQDGKSIDEVKRLLGHQNRKTTEIYARLGNEQLREASKDRKIYRFVEARVTENGR
jgi:integrase